MSAPKGDLHVAKTCHRSFRDSWSRSSEWYWVWPQASFGVFLNVVQQVSLVESVQKLAKSIVVAVRVSGAAFD